MEPGSGSSVVKEKSSVGCFASDCSSDSPQAEESGTVGSLHCDAFRDRYPGKGCASSWSHSYPGKDAPFPPVRRQRGRRWFASQLNHVPYVLW